MKNFKTRVDMYRSIQIPMTTFPGEKAFTKTMSPFIDNKDCEAEVASRQNHLKFTRRNIKTDRGSTVTVMTPRHNMSSSMSKKTNKVTVTHKVARQLPPGWNKVPDGFTKLRAISTDLKK